MHMMLSVASECKAEIGMRRTAGALRRHLRARPVFEAVALATPSTTPVWVAARTWPQLPLQIVIERAACAVLLAAGSGVLFGLLPAARTGMFDPEEALRDD